MSGVPAQLGQGFLFGVAFAVALAGIGAAICLLIWIANALWDRFSPAERRRRKANKRPVFRKTSLQARAGWIISCLEKALAACGLESERDEPGSWYSILQLLRQVEELPPEKVPPQWVDQVSDMIPSFVLSPCPDPREPVPTPEERQRSDAARALYLQAGPRMALLGPLVELIYRLVRDYWDDPSADLDDSLLLMDQARELLEAYNIPLLPEDAGQRPHFSANSDKTTGKPT